VTTLLGLLAGALTTGAWLPQIVRTWRTRSAGDISWGYLAAMGLGFVLWLLYGVAADSVAVAVTNVVGLVLVASLAAVKVRADEPLTLTELDLEPVG
jgi:MtN3 and saliva related transmembrane protein